MTGDKPKRFLSAEERRERLARLPAEWHIAGVVAGDAMAGVATPRSTIESLHRVLTGETTADEERARFFAELREGRAENAD